MDCPQKELYQRLGLAEELYEDTKKQRDDFESQFMELKETAIEAITEKEHTINSLSKRLMILEAKTNDFNEEKTIFENEREEMKEKMIQRERELEKEIRDNEARRRDMERVRPSSIIKYKYYAHVGY